MKKIFIVMYVFLLSVFNINSDTKPNNSYYARSYVLMDGNNSSVLEGDDYHAKRSVASISKLITAIIALESNKLFYSYIVPNEAIDVEGSSVYLKEGESYRLIDLVYGLLLRSGNDAAYAISIIVSKTTNNFVNYMNEFSKKIGMKNSSFSNPCGLDIKDEGNISTAYDMALCMRYCMNNDLFREIISTKEYRFGTHLYVNKNKLLKSFKYCLGGKTGYTYKAKRTLVTAAEKDGQYLIMVTLDCGGDYAFHKQLYEHYFNEYHYLVFLKRGVNYIDCYKFITKYTIGIRLDKTIELVGIKKYFVSPIDKKLIVSFIDSTGKEYYGEDFFEVEFEKIA